MNPLMRRLHRFLSQDVPRQNAALAAGHMTRERQQRDEVLAYLARAARAPEHRAPPGRRSAVSQ